MAPRKTWVWILVGVFTVGLVSLIAVAGAGIYFVTHHIKTERTTSADALRAFEDVTTTFANQRPLYDLDDTERPRATRPLAELPTSTKKPQSLRLLAWDPDEERLVNLSLPFWILQFGHGKMELAGKGHDFDLDRLNLDVVELERIGPALVCDFREHAGVRVLVWTQ